MVFLRQNIFMKVFVVLCRPSQVHPAIRFGSTVICLLLNITGDKCQVTECLYLGQCDLGAA